jgi:hypothetical protein
VATTLGYPRITSGVKPNLLCGALLIRGSVALTNAKSLGSGLRRDDDSEDGKNIANAAGA